MLGWEEHLDKVRDSRPRALIPTSAVVRATVVMFLARLGSLNALEQSRPSRFWPKWVGRELPSADTIGRVCALVEPTEVRDLHQQMYTRLKRGKALEPPAHGLTAAILDAHESHATRRRHCSGCLARTIHTRQGDVIEYYHRSVTLQLVTRDLCPMLDAEPIRPGEDEIAAAVRLLERVVARYPRAFDVILGDSLYADSRVFNLALKHHKHAMAVLKENRHALLEEATLLLDQSPTVCWQEAGVRYECAEVEGITTWSTVQAPVRAIRSRETWFVRRQLDKKSEEQHGQWIWVTTLGQRSAGTAATVRLGHRRWVIENLGFNEIATRWFADHVYRHDSTAMLNFWLLAMACLNLFMAFYARNLKPAARRAASMLHISRLILAELYHAIPTALIRASP